MSRVCMFCGEIQPEPQLCLIVELANIHGRGVVCHTCVESAPYQPKVIDPDQLELNFGAQFAPRYYAQILLKLSSVA